jgi:hypothetical protein
MLQGKLQDADKAPQEAKPQKQTPGLFSEIIHSSLARQMTRTAGTMIVRSLLGTLGLGGRRKR